MSGKASQGKASQGKASQGEASQGKASQGKASQGKASQGKASQGKASQGKASQGKASQGKASQGKGKSSEEGRISQDYSSESYWDQRYQNGGNHEWYYSFSLLKPLFEKCVGGDGSFEGSILEIGCGDKPLIDGFEEMVGTNADLHAIDYSKAIIDALKKGENASRITYGAMDARKVSFEDNSFDFVVDKGTIDAMLCSEDEEQAFANVRSIVSEALRIMKKSSAKFMIVSHLEVDSDDFNSVLQNCVVPCLDEHRAYIWAIEAHVVKTIATPHKKNGKKRTNAVLEESGGFGTVYIIQSTPRKVTRNMLYAPAEVGFEVLEYSDGEEDDGQE